MTRRPVRRRKQGDTPADKLTSGELSRLWVAGQRRKETWFMIAIPFLFLAFLVPYFVMAYYYSEDRVEPGPLGPLACRVGITTDPVERKAYWEGQYPGLNGWEVLTTHGSKSAAESAEGTAARVKGCLPHAGGPEGEGGTWYVFYFHKGQQGSTASDGP